MRIRLTRLLRLALAFVLVIALMPMNVVYAEAQDGGTSAINSKDALIDAIAAAGDGDTITLSEGIELDQTITIDKNLTIDGSNKALTYTGTDRAFQITGGTVEIKNLTINMTNAPEGSRGVNLYNGSTNAAIDVTLTNVTVNGGKAYAVNIGGGQDNKLTINDSALTGYAAINVNAASVNHTISVNGSTLNGKNHNNNFHFGAVVVDGSNANSLTITDSTVTTENLEGVTNTYYEVLVGANCTVNVCDGIDVAVRNVYNNNDGLYYVGLADAVACAKDGDTLVMLGGETISETIKVKENITLDLKGKTITGKDNGTASFAVIEVQPGAELTVKDSGVGGKITLISANNRGWNAYSSVLSNQRGKLIVESGTIEHLGGTDMAYGIDNLTNGKNTYAETVITGGTVKSPYRAIRQFLNGIEAQNILTVNGGTIEGANKSIWMQDPSAKANTGKLTVSSNAKLNGDVYLFVTAGSTEWPVEVKIAASAVNGEVLSGNVPAGYVVDKVDGFWGVFTRVEIIQQPEDVAVEIGETAETTVVATGKDLTYQWYLKNSGSTKFYESSVVTDTYTVKMAENIDGRQIYCVITDQNGNTVQTDTVTLSVKRPLAITAQPESVTVAEGEYAKTTVKAEGDGLTYVWYWKNADALEFSESALTTATYSTKMTAEKDGRQVYCVITDKYENTVQTDTVTLMTEKYAKIITQPENATGLVGDSLTVSVIATGDGLTYQWYLKNPGASKFAESSITADTYPVKLTETNDGRQVYCVVTDKYGNSVQSSTVTLSVKKTLAITSQPQNVTVAEGATAKTTVKATGDELTYQWFWKNAGAEEFSESSLTTASYSAQMTSERDGRQVYCVITDKYGNTVQTNTVTLLTEKTVKIITQPENASGLVGDTLTVSITATGDGLTYQWYLKNPGASNFAKSSVTSDTYSVKLGESMDGRKIYCVVTDKYGNSVQSKTVTLSEFKNTAKITVQPQSTSGLVGETVTVSLTATGDGLTYQWYLKNPGASKFAKSSITSDTYSVKLGESMDGRQIYCVVTDQYGNTVQSNTVTLSVKKTLSITSQPKDASAVEGTAVKTSVQATGNGLTYQWYYKNAGDEVFAESAMTTATYSITMTAARDGREVYCVVTDQNGNTVTSDIATLTMVPSVKITSQPKNASAASGAIAKSTVQATGDGLTYQWYIKNPGATKFAKSSVTSATYSMRMTSSNDGRKAYCIITDAYGNTVKTNTVTITIK